MKRKIVYISLAIVIFLIGVEVGLRKSFPYPQIKYIKTLMIGKDRVNSRLFYTAKLIHESLLPWQHYNIMMLGDSITDRTDWNELLGRTDILNRGISGDNTDGMLLRLNSFPQSIKKAFIMIGINDLGKGSSVNYIFTNYIKIIKKLKKQNIVPVIQSTLYITHDTKNRKNTDVKYLNTLLLDYAEENNLTYIDLNQHLSCNGHLCNDYSDDGIHLNRKGYAVWRSILKKFL